MMMQDHLIQQPVNALWEKDVPFDVCGKETTQQ